MIQSKIKIIKLIQLNNKPVSKNIKFLLMLFLTFIKKLNKKRNKITNKILPKTLIMKILSNS
jgi:hypothetical protein